MTKPKAFATPDELRRWFRKHHADVSELIIRCFKTHTRDKGVTYRQSLDEALCVGWIDGVGRRLDADSYAVRFTPRRANSKWSDVNRRHFKRLKAEGRMQPSGEAAFRARNRRAKPYSFETKPMKLDRASAAALKANPRAWAFFQSQPPWYRRTSIFLVMSAKRPETRQKRLKVLISSSAAGRTIPALTRD
jgi:uncharacterized protein YdeI (YjbR/CyaY-like superfamily)